MTEKEAILAWLEKTFPGCEFEIWLGEDLNQLDRMVTITRL